MSRLPFSLFGYSAIIQFRKADERQMPRKRTRVSGVGRWVRRHLNGRDLRFFIPATFFVAGGIFVGLLFFSPLGHIIGDFTQEHVNLPVNIVSKGEDTPDWKKQERINILLLGVDRRPDEVNSPTRTDTMLIVTIDPYGKTAGMLSIPRDLWVPIPISDSDIRYNRINTAYFYGDLYNFPGGGPALAEKTVEHNFPGVNIHYYAVVDFEGFSEIIDTLGGITVYLESPLIDYEYPTPDYGTMYAYIPAGEQRLDGEKTLWYARSRYEGADIGRMKRQQQILLAMRESILQLDILPKLPRLVKQFADTVKTDLSLSELQKLAELARRIKAEDIIARSIDMNYATQSYKETKQGMADVLELKQEKASQLIEEMFYDARLREDGASVEVLNGTMITGLAAGTSAFLKSQGVTEVAYGDAADGINHQETIIYNFTGKDYTAGLIAHLLNLPANRIQSHGSLASLADICVVLGEDAPAPYELGALN